MVSAGQFSGQNFSLNEELIAGVEYFTGLEKSNFRDGVKHEDQVY
jgi:hypothetical protein